MTQVVAGFSLWRPGFNPRPDHVGFVFEKVALGQLFFGTAAYPSQYHSTNAPCSFTWLLQIQNHLSNQQHC